MAYKTDFSCREIAAFLGGRLSGDPDARVTGLGRIESAEYGDVTFYTQKKYAPFLENLRASCLLAPPDFDETVPEGVTVIHTENPYVAFVMLLRKIVASAPKKSGYVHPTAVIDETAKVHPTATIEAGCYVGQYSEIGENATLKPGAIINDNVKIGDGTLIHSGVVICDDTLIGKNCVINPGAVIGGDGFGFIEDPEGAYHKIPQLGNVVIGDDCEIGSNTTIDRAMIGSTIIENGVKIDNLVQIAHNVIIGENTGIVSQVGISGSAKIGKRNRFGGQAGIAGHLEIADDVTLLARSGVGKSITRKGLYFGAPVKDRLQGFKIEAAISNLPETVKEIAKMKREILELKESQKKD